MLRTGHISRAGCRGYHRLLVITDVRVEWFYDGSVRCYVLPDGTLFRLGSGNSDAGLTIHKMIMNHYGEKYGLIDLRPRFYEIKPPSRRWSRSC